MNYEFLSKVAMDKLDLVCYITDLETNTLLYLNKTARDLFEVEEDAYFGLTCHEVIYRKKKPCSFCNSAYLREDAFLSFNTYIEQNKKNYTIQSTIIKIDDKAYRLSIGSDVTHILGELTQLEDKLSSEQTLLACINAFINSTDIDIAINKLLTIVANYYKAQRASLFKVDNKAQLAYHTHEWAQTEDLRVSAQIPLIEFNKIQHIISSFYKENKYSFRSREEVLQHSPELYALFTKLEIENLMMVPLLKNDEIIFFLTIDNPCSNIENFNLLNSVALFILENIRKVQTFEQLEKLSFTDTLTGIYNRNKYIARLEELDSSKLQSFGVVHVDANSLKKINEVYGPDHGDQMLINIANTLSKFIPVELYRVAGDEFVGFCLDIDQLSFEKLIHTLRIEYSKNPDYPFAVGGIWQNKNINIPLAITQSGEIMLAEKQHYYKNLSETMQYSSHSTEIILSEIRNGHYSVYLQPKVDFISGVIAGAEALVRKTDENGKIIPPDKFLPIYEIEGTIRYIDFFVFEKVCQLLQRLIQKGKALKIAVNFSRVTFMIYDLVDEIVKICDKYNIPHEYIKVEITESIDKLDFDFFAKKLHEVHEAGFEVSLDDFGAKHSNLMMLSRAEFTEVKIDKGLVDNIATSNQNKTIIRNIIKIIKELGSSICVAEGIETKEQSDILQELGCTYGQGYYFYKPLPIDEFLLVYEKNEQKTKIELNDVTSEFLASFKLPEEIANITVASMPLGFNLWNDKRETVMCNNKSLEIFNLKTYNEYLTNFFLLSPEFQPNGRPTAEAVLEGLNEVRYNGFIKFNWLHCDLEGNEIPAEVSLIKIHSGNLDHTDYILGFTRDLREQLEEYHQGNTVEKYFYNALSTQELLNMYSSILDIDFWHYNNKTKTIQFYGEEFVKLGLAHQKIHIDDKETIKSFIYKNDLEEFDEFIYALKAGMKKKREISFILSSKTIQKYKLNYKVLYDEHANPTHSVGKMVKIH